MADQALEIHHIDIGGGDATAILVRDDGGKIVKKVLIDAGASGGGSESLTSYINAYLESGTPFDYIIASHYHDDHIKGFEKANIQFKGYVDIGGYVISKEKSKFDPINGSGLQKTYDYFKGYRNHIEANITKNKAARLDVPFIRAPVVNGPLVIKLGGDADGATLTCYCANGILADGTNVLDKQKEKKGRAYDPNDLSFAFILEWDTFRYFTAGDLSGDPENTSYYDMEHKLVTYLKEEKKLPVTAMKVTHHGSERSSYFDATAKTGFLDALDATTLIIPCNEVKDVPHPNFLSRLYTYAFAKNTIVKDTADAAEKVAKDATEKAKAAETAAATYTTIFFLNDLSYRSSNAEYAGMAKIIKENSFSCNAVITDGVVSNDARSIVLRRLAGGGEDSSKMDTNEIRCPRQDTGDKKYYVIVRNKRFTRSGGTSKRQTQYTITSPITFNSGTSMGERIQAGFGLQAEQIVNWLTEDETNKTQEGSDYIKKYYPSLFRGPLAPLNLKDTLVKTLTDLFNTIYTLKDFGDGTSSYLVKPLASDSLSGDDEKTIYKTLTGNKYQIAVSQAYGMSSKGYWNDTGEPYGKSVVEKRSQPLELQVRQSKRLKK